MNELKTGIIQKCSQPKLSVLLPVYILVNVYTRASALPDRMYEECVES